MSKLVEREPARSRRSFATAPALAVQFFLIPLMVVGMVALVYGGFRMLLVQEGTPEEFLRDVQMGGRDRRWPAAYELSRLMSDPEVESKHPGLGAAIVQAFEDSAGDDPRVRRYLALAVGRLATPPSRAVAVLVEGLRDDDTETQISVMWALAALGNASIIGEIDLMYASSDAGVRKMAVYALGALPGDRALPTLTRALGDAVADVQWNAAVSLARHGNPDGEVVLARMLNREYVERNVTRTTTVDAVIDPVSEVMVSGLQAVEVLGSARLRDEVVRLSLDDESLRVRDMAMRTLQAIGPS
jgi:hypothetical protein